MRIPNYDSPAAKTKCKQLKSFMPNDNFRMLICGPSGYGKTNTLMHMIHQLLYYDKIYLHSKNLEQPKYTRLLKKICPY